jgi:hypothetical protein
VETVQVVGIACRSESRLVEGRACSEGRREEVYRWVGMVGKAFRDRWAMVASYQALEAARQASRMAESSLASLVFLAPLAFLCSISVRRHYISNDISYLEIRVVVGKRRLRLLVAWDLPVLLRRMRK